MSTIWTRFLPFTEGPWRVQDPNRGIIYDLQDRKICTVPKAGEIPFSERQANLAAICLVPELVAALRQAAYALDQQGTPLKPEFYDLINRATPGVDELVPRQLREAGITSICELDNYASYAVPKEVVPTLPTDTTESGSTVVAPNPQG